MFEESSRESPVNMESNMLESYRCGLTDMLGEDSLVFLIYRFMFSV